MFERKLRALSYPDDAKAIDIEDTSHFRKLVLWLEDLNICNYTIDERQNLRGIGDDEVWTTAFTKYLVSLDCPYTPASPRGAIIDWLLGVAISIKYADENPDDYKVFNTAASTTTTTPVDSVSGNPLDNLDPTSDDFKTGVQELAKLLKITPHPNHVITLQAICKLVEERLSTSAVAQVSQKSSGLFKSGQVQFSLDDCELGFDAGKDPVLIKAAKILRLLHVRQLRQLQTGINETIVAVQELTADPRTDERLGKVGYM